METLETPYASPKAQVSIWRWSMRLIAALLLVTCLMACSGIAFLLGSLSGEQSLYANQSRELRIRVEAVLQVLPGDYSAIRIERTSNGEVRLSGDLSAQELQDLKQAIQVQLGGELAEDLTR